MLCIPGHLARHSIDQTIAEASKALADPDVGVVIDIVAYDYFDESVLERLTAFADAFSNRVEIRGLDGYALALLDPPIQRDQRPGAGAVTRLSTVVLVTARLLSHDDWDEALASASAIATAGGAPIVTLDLDGVGSLSPAQLIAIAELSGDLEHARQMFLIVNAAPDAAESLKTAGLSGNLWMASI